MWKAFWLGVMMCGLVCAAENPFVGTWKRTNHSIKYYDGADGKGYKDHTFIITANGPNGLTITEDIVIRESDSYRVTTSAQFDGKDYQVVGGRRKKPTYALERVDARTVRITFKDGGQLLGTSEMTVAKDGKTLRYIQDATTPAGRKFKSEETFERE